ncbi:MAG: hypothetical protein M1832_002006, partial [Thelocarpon impressellum]
MLGYFMADDEQLGLDPTIGKLEGEGFIDIVRNHQAERLILTKVLRKQALIVGRGTTCWRVYREGDEQKKPLVVKDSWQYVERPEEGKLIREATECHESLLNAGILHRDISAGNIMLAENEEDGFLIDMDLAMKISNESASGAPTMTGTKVFMAIGALYGEHHTFMHDLESFFWVLFWI